MKKPVLIILFSLQVLILLAVVANTYLIFINKSYIRSNQQVIIDTQDRLSSTFTFMDNVESKRKQTEATKQPLIEGTEAPSFGLQNETGKQINLEDFRGKKVLLVFSQKNCLYCRDFYPILNEFQTQRKDVDVIIMQLNSTPEQNKKYKQKEGIKAPLLAASYQELKAFKVKRTPTSVLLDEEGKVLGTKMVSTLEELIEFVEDSCKECSVDS